MQNGVEVVLVTLSGRGQARLACIFSSSDQCWNFFAHARPCSADRLPGSHTSHTAVAKPGTCGTGASVFAESITPFLQHGASYRCRSPNTAAP